MAEDSELTRRILADAEKVRKESAERAQRELERMERERGEK